MSKHDHDWLDDYILMEMIKEDESSTSKKNNSGSSSSNTGCLPFLLLPLTLAAAIKLFRLL